MNFELNESFLTGFLACVILNCLYAFLSGFFKRAWQDWKAWRKGPCQRCGDTGFLTGNYACPDCNGGDEPKEKMAVVASDFHVPQLSWMGPVGLGFKVPEVVEDGARYVQSPEFEGAGIPMIGIEGEWIIMTSPDEQLSPFLSDEEIQRLRRNEKKVIDWLEDKDG